MSSVQPFPLKFNRSNITSYYSSKTGSATLQPTSTGGTSSMIGFKSNSEQSVTINDAAKDQLFPNSTAKPTSAHITLRHTSGSILSIAYAGLYFGSTRLFNESQGYGLTKTTDQSFSNSAVTGANKNTTIKFSGYSTNGSYSCFVVDATLTLNFTRYDFSAAAGTGVTSASVSSSTGYDGDTITFTASLQSGYVFDGWYSGSTKVSSSQTYVHTVAGADMALTAKAIASSKTVTTKYGNTTIATEQWMPPVAVSYGSTQIASISSGETKTLNCSDNLMSSNLTVGGKTLLCANQIMNGNIIVSVS